MNNSDARLKFLDLQAKDYTFEFYPNKIETNADLPGLNRQKSKIPYLEDDPVGNIRIYYPSINDAGIHYSETKKSFDFYKRIRLIDPDEDGKYKSPAGSGIKIFIPLNTLQKIRAKDQIEILHIVEGEIKAIYGDHFGLDIIGITGIHMFIAKKGSKDLHPDIIKIIEVCQVKILNLIFDSDTRVVKFEFKNNIKKDYSQRLVNFESAIVKFKLACFNYNKLSESRKSKASSENSPEDIGLKYYFTQIRQEFIDRAKGLDDLYELINNSNEINLDLNKLSHSKKFFLTKNLKEVTKKDLREYFWLNMDLSGCPTNFFYNFYEYIQDHIFVFYGNIYKPNDKGTLDILFHKELNEYVRVGIDYWREVTKTQAGLNKNNELVKLKKKGITKWNKAEIREDFIFSKGIRNTFSIIKRYTGFTNIPAHDSDYNKIIDEEEYNLYHPISHKLENKPWDNIKLFLKHVSDNEYNNKYNLLLDMFYLKYNMPLQKLPITVLYSKEKNTGKSTFLWLLNEIYQDNAAVVTNKDIDDAFTEYLLTNVLLMDEVVINDKALESIKSLSTAEATTINEKNLPRVKVSFFASFFMTTNKLTFVNIDDDENRFFILHIPPIKKESLDPNLLQKMKEEIPGFLYYLKKEHKLTFETRQTRFWFPFNELETQALKELKSKSQKMSLRALKEWVKEMLFNHKITDFEATPTIIAPELRPFTTRDISHTEVKNTLTDDFYLKASPVHKFGFPKLEGDPSNPDLLISVWENKYFDKNSKTLKYYQGSTYTLKASDFLEADELTQLQELIYKESENSPADKEREIEVQTELPY